MKSMTDARGDAVVAPCRSVACSSEMPSSARQPSSALRVGLRQQRRLVIDVEHARGVLGALDVARHPEQVIGGAGEHLRSRQPVSNGDRVVAREGRRRQGSRTSRTDEVAVRAPFTREDDMPFGSVRSASVLQHPGVLRAAALRRVDHQRAFAQRDAREAARRPSSRRARTARTAAGRCGAARCRRRRRSDTPTARASAARCTCRARATSTRAERPRSRAIVDAGPTSMP